MLDDVVHNWDRWAGTMQAARRLRRWALDEPALHGWALSELRQPQSSARTDAMQAALVRLSQDGDSNAVATLLTQLRPGLGSLSAWLVRADPRLDRFDAAAAEVVSTCSETIMRHDLDRRPAKIAANLLLDTRQKLWRAVARERPSSCELPEAAAMTGETEVVSATIDLVGSVARALHRLGGSEPSRQLTAELAFRAWFLDEPSGEIAADLGLRGQMVRTRLCRLRTAVRHEHLAGVR